MRKIKFILYFSTLLACIYLLRFHNQEGNHPPQSRILGALKDKYCSDSSITELTSSDIANAADFREQFFKLMRNNENQLKKTLKNDDWLGYVESMLPAAIVWMILLFISIIGWICYCTCCCCDHHCPPSCCRRDLEVKPYQGFELWGVIMFLIIFATGIVGVSTAGIVYSTQVQAGTLSTVCSLVTIYDDTVYGTTYNSTRWLGIYPVMDRINNIIAQLADLPNQFYSTFGDTSWIDIGSSNLIMQNRNIYNKYKSAKLPSPDPSSAGSAVNSLFIDTSLGPYNATETMTGSIEAQIQATSIGFSSSLKGVYSASKTVADTSSDTSSVLNSSTSQIRATYDSLNTYQDRIDSLLDAEKTYFVQINNGFYAAWAVNIFTGLIAILGAVGVYLLKWSRLRILLHCSWCLMSALMILGFVLSSIFVPLAILTMESCDLYDDIITTEGNFLEYTELIPSDINSKLRSCLFGDGNLLNEFGIDNEVDTLHGVSQSLDDLSSINQQFSNGNENSTLTYSDVLIWRWGNTTYNLEKGLSEDSNATDLTNSFRSLEVCNQWSDYDASGSLQNPNCQTTQDNWVFNFSNCTYSNQWQSGSSATEQLGLPICIQVSDFDSNLANNRYATLQGCPSSVSTKILSYFSSLKSHDTSRRALFSGLGTELTNLRTTNDNYTSKLLEFNTTVYSFISGIHNFIGNVSDSQNGLVVGFNCGFLRQVARQSYNAMCVQMFVPIYLQMIFVCTTSMLMFLSSLLAYLAGMRFGKIHKKSEVDSWGGSPN